jgi:hypothetical protein
MTTLLEAGFATLARAKRWGAALHAAGTAVSIRFPLRHSS